MTTGRKKLSKPSASVSVDLGAKASFDVSVKTEIPSQNTGRLVDALTDLIRPFSEARGLRADQIRLQREEVLIEVAKLAKQRVEIENQPIRPLPTKILVPLLEKASLEDPSDHYMIETWGNLLASGALQRAVQPRFVNVLAELTAAQARLLEHVVLKKCERDLSGLPRELRGFDGLRHDLNAACLRKICSHAFKHPKTPLDTLVKSLDGIFDCRGVVLAHMRISRGDLQPVEKVFSIQDEAAINLSILKSLDLIQATEFNFENKKYDVFVFYYQIAVLGLALLSACSPRVNVVLKEIEKRMRE
jgi:hypothetical protein